MALLRSRAQRVFTGVSATLLLLLAANLPFDAGATPVGGFSRRMEPGRLELVRSDTHSPQSFWLAGNTEGLKWAPRTRLGGRNQWRVHLPLWIPLAGSLAWCAWSWRAPRGGRPQSPKNDAMRAA